MKRGYFSMLLMLSIVTIGLILVGCGSDNTSPAFPPNTFTGVATNSASPSPSTSSSTSPTSNPSPTSSVSPSQTPTPTLHSLVVALNQRGRSIAVGALQNSPSPAFSPAGIVSLSPTPAGSPNTFIAPPAVAMAVPSGSPTVVYAYVTNGSTSISQFVANPAKGTLQANTPATVPSHARIKSALAPVASPSPDVWQVVTDPSQQFTFTSEIPVGGGGGGWNIVARPINTDGTLGNAISTASSLPPAPPVSGGLISLLNGTQSIVVFGNGASLETYVETSPGVLSSPQPLPSPSSGGPVAATVVGSTPFAYQAIGGGLIQPIALVGPSASPSASGTPVSLPVPSATPSSSNLTDVQAMSIGNFSSTQQLYALSTVQSNTTNVQSEAEVDAFTIAADGSIQNTGEILIPFGNPDDPNALAISIAVENPPPPLLPRYLLVGVTDSSPGSTHNPNLYYVALGAGGALPASATPFFDGDTNTVPDTSGPVAISIFDFFAVP